MAPTQSGSPPRWLRERSPKGPHAYVNVHVLFVHSPVSACLARGAHRQSPAPCPGHADDGLHPNLRGAGLSCAALPMALERGVLRCAGSRICSLAEDQDRVPSLGVRGSG